MKFFPRESRYVCLSCAQDGVATQREVVDNQRDLTNAELRYAGAISDYNTSLAELRPHWPRCDRLPSDQPSCGETASGRHRDPN